jgi:predicted metalloprotease
MRWQGNRQSENVEDVRGAGGGGGFHLGGGSIGLGTVAIAVVAGWLFGINPLTILGLMSGGTTQEAPVAQKPPADDEMARFVSTVLADTEDVWRAKFRQAGQTYRDPKLVLFRGSTPTACGQGQAAMGPFYCPLDEKVYIDLRFYETMRSRMGAPGDFAQAYVIAHEVGHHVQRVLGITDKVESMRSRMSPTQGNALSVRLELQADCFAGVWAHDAQAARQVLEQGDVEEALNAASQIGDDMLQRRSQGTIVPESFTHGTSAQRVNWFKRGLQTGSINQCNTFEAREL